MIRKGNAAEIAKAEGRVLADFSTFRGWRDASWMNTEAKVEAKDGIVTIVGQRRDGERDMLGYGKPLAADLTTVKVLKIRMKADKGAPFGVEWSIDGKLTRLRSYVPATGEWETISLPLTGKRATGLTLILAESNPNAKWASPTVTYQFDQLWLE